MKEMIILISILILVFVPSIFLGNFLENSGEEIAMILDDMDKDFASDKSIDKSKSERLEKAFCEKESKWLMVLDHEALDELEATIEECIAYYNGDDEVEFSMAYGKAKHYLEDFAKREKISIINLF